MELKKLRSFVTVASLKNFSAAARVLNTVQPAISRHISDLEEEVGVSLFWRNTRDVKITPAGESLLVNAQKILEAEICAVDQARRASRGEIGILRIGYLSSASFTFLPDLIRKYSDVYPEVKISLLEMTVPEQIEAFEEGRLEIGISRPMAENIKRNFFSEIIYQDSLMALVPETHELAGRNSLELKEMASESFILFNRNDAPGLFDQILDECRRENFVPEIQKQSKNMQTILTEVASGLGVAIVPGCVRSLYSKGCIFLPIKNQESSIATELHYRREPHLSVVDSFIALMKESKEMISQIQLTNDQ